MDFVPDYRYMRDAALNVRPGRLPLYEHKISRLIMEKVIGCEFADFEDGGDSDLDFFFANYFEFYRQMTYDAVSYEVCISRILPGGGALRGGKAGPIQNRKDFDSYPWDELESLYWDYAKKKFDALKRNMPAGVKAIGGVGNGVFELSEDLVGLEYLAYMQIDDAELLADVYEKVGDLMTTIWARFLRDYKESFVVCRFGDDLGFKSGTLVSPAFLRQYLFGQYARVINLIKSEGVPFLWHSCGNIFSVMDDVIELGINAKHSNEDVISPFDRWIDDYGEKIGLFGGIDVDVICQESVDVIRQKVFEDGLRFRNKANGYALGSGNSIPDYVPVEGYLAMIDGVKAIREFELRS